jgi:hypothetical protein
MMMSAVPGESVPLPSYPNANVMGLLIPSSHCRVHSDTLPVSRGTRPSFHLDYQFISFGHFHPPVVVGRSENMYVNGHPFAIVSVDYLCAFIVVRGCTYVGECGVSSFPQDPAYSSYFLSLSHFLLHGCAM